VAEKTFTNNTKQAPKDRSCVYVGAFISCLRNRESEIYMMSSNSAWIS